MRTVTFNKEIWVFDSANTSGYQPDYVLRLSSGPYARAFVRVRVGLYNRKWWVSLDGMVLCIDVSDFEGAALIGIRALTEKGYLTKVLKIIYGGQHALARPKNKSQSGTCSPGVSR